jgi:hypothetical protein
MAGPKEGQQVFEGFRSVGELLRDCPGLDGPSDGIATQSDD